ncbi:hypothetical protein [Acetobacteroides hydrogenigenes]|uniref:Uncharacterized protein n=1 Tax=Acetobacteroides hydrogenigenes TaxID=979970 RepID=A0A4R2EK00_9BACT|nr:hypothetical protein [Acetobacteroides hydrogenigenes]TCN67606.1 hypothetical protein CLV25_10765 [Acetobacteroides hydrogenigenes]
MFERLFGKKDSKMDSTTTLKKGEKFVAFEDNTGYKILRQLSPELQDLLDKSPLKLMQTQLFMHYWDSKMKEENINDPTWQNQAIYFWKAEEPFEKKSLPPFFEEYEKKFFVIIKESPYIKFMSAKAIPWFGMPGMGDKIWGNRGGKDITIKELANENIIEFINFVDLVENNISILSQSGEYYFLVDDRIVRFDKGDFFIKDKRIPLSLAYKIGGVHIVKKVENKEDHSRFMPK